MPTETQTPRLIDANALLEEVKSLNKKNPDFAGAPWNTIDDAIFLINSAPTVETTDDVMARITYPCEVSTLPKWIYQDDGNRCCATAKTSPASEISEFGKTPLEAVKKLEASLNQK